MKLWCCRRPAGGKQQSTGLLHSIGSNPSRIRCKKTPSHGSGWVFFRKSNITVRKRGKEKRLGV